MNMRILGIVAAFVLCCTAACADTTPRGYITPVQAELMADMHARLLKVGSTVFAKVTVDWKGTDCVLRNGAVLEAHVISVVPDIKPAKGSQVSLAFTRAQCGQVKMGDFEMLLAAVGAPPSNSDLGIMSENLPVLNTGAMGLGGMATLSSMKNSTDYNLDLQTTVLSYPIDPRTKIGHVSGIRGLNLSVGTGPENSSTLSSRDHDVALLKHTVFLLIPSQGTFPRAAQPGSSEPASGDASGSSSAPDAPPPPPPIDEIDRCAPPQCNVALPAGDAIDASNAVATISIRQLGFAPRPQKEMKSFDNDEALAYLGPRELLVAFNPHKLVSRHTLGRSGPIVRVIRAVLVNTETHQVTHTIDWELPDNRQYLWPLTEGRVLVHVGSELRVYGSGFKIENRVDLDGPLAFVRVTPDGSFMAIGVSHERHTPELHAQLSENLNGEPEEDVTILVLNRNFETIAKSNARSGLMAPTLLNEGQAKLQALPNNRYRISMTSWDNHPSVITRFTSGCTPELSSIAPDLIFLVSCDKQDDEREYRVLHSDGKVVLKSDLALNELGHAAEGNTSHNAFVVKTVQSSLTAPPGDSFRAENFSSEELRVYRATDGKRRFGVRVTSPSPSRDGYALSTDGAQLAVLTREEIAVYAVPGK
jgi:hypothetical protein